MKWNNAFCCYFPPLLRGSLSIYTHCVLLKIATIKTAEFPGAFYTTDLLASAMLHTKRTIVYEKGP